MQCEVDSQIGFEVCVLDEHIYIYIYTYIYIQIFNRDVSYNIVNVFTLQF